jgi:osmotically-inducible protein OsmY
VRRDIILDGRVSDRALATQIAAHIAATPGVRRVYNHLATVAQITDLITAALALDERTTWETIDVAYAGGTATLRGVVTSAEARQAAEEIARRTPLVGRVENALVVQQPTHEEVSYANHFYDQPWRSTAPSDVAALPVG